jgi:signal transduction histidine kinase
MAEEELSRIVLDIHDGPVQYLFTALSLLTGIQQDVNDVAADTDLAPRLARVATLLESSLYEIKFFLGTFRPPEFRRRTMQSLAEGLVIQHEEWTGATVDLVVEGVPATLPLAVKIAFYRIVQEALSNASRHAGVDHFSVYIWGEEEWLGLEVRDEGRGFEPPDFDEPNEEVHAAHIGLYGMRDRIQLLGGKFTLESKPGAGTRIRAEVPIHG